jgi:hypothetical protein
MIVNQIDELFDEILNKFNVYLLKEKVFERLNNDTNFVKYQNDILNYIKKFIESIAKKDILNIITKETNYETVINIIKRYCAFYIYLGIAYYYKGNRDLYITNIIEAGKYQKDALFQIPNFFNSDNNSKIISFYTDIKNFLFLLESKTTDKIKILLVNNPLKYETTIKLFNDLGEDYINEYFLINNNFHNIIKAIIFKQIYIKEDKNDIFNILNQQEKDNAEYKYIEIVVSNQQKIVDFNVIQKFLSNEKLNIKLSEEVYDYLVEFRDTKEFVIKENKDFINYLFTNEIIIPITEDFLRYHKDTERYDPESLVASSNIKDRDATKIKYIISKMSNIQNYYSPILDKNAKLKIETEKYFYKGLDPKMAIIYNNDEEIKIIQKLEMSDNATDYDLLVDLENIRKYAYVNFKNFSKDGIKIRPSKTIQGIRYINLKHKKKNPLELRIGHDNIDMNIVGIAWNPSKRPLECFNSKTLVTSKKENGYNEFIKYMSKTFNNKNKELYYWLFDTKHDKPKLESYINYGDDIQNNIKIMIEQIYYKYIFLVKDKLNSYLDSVKELNNWELNNIYKYYTQKYFDFNLNKEFKNEIIEKGTAKIIEYEIIEDEVDSMMPGKREKIIKLPLIKIDAETKNIIVLGEKEIDVSLELSNKNIPICQHYIKWRNINKMSKKTDDFNQAIFEFVKQYIKQNERGDYLCKSCNELVQIQKFVVEGSYIEDQDVFLTTSITVNLKLEEMPKYTKYMRTIRNIEKNIEKFAYSLDILAYLGNTPVVKLRRKMVIKDVIDLVILHTEWIKKQPKDRIEQSSKKYGINKDLTNLFFFELKDDIFLTSSTDTDYYKIIKYNNIMAYLILIMITEMNSGQILSLREDKKYNYFFFKKIGHNLFSDLFLRINQKEKIPFSKLPLLSYVLYYLSGMMVSSRLWLYNDKDVDSKNKLTYIVGLQKTIIHTVIDLINSIEEANLEVNKNFLYEVITMRIKNKLNYTYNDSDLIKRIEYNTMKFINYDVTTNKVAFKVKKIELVNIDSEYNILDKIEKKCENINKLEIIPTKSDSNLIDFLTNCSDGKFHNWVFKSNDLICSLCNNSYNELLKVMDITTEKSDFEYLDKIKINNLKKLSKKYCITGELHDFDTSGKCVKCKFDSKTELTNKELQSLEKNLDLKTNEVSLIQINKMKEYSEKEKQNKEKTKKIINKLLKRYEKETEHKIESYVIKFVDRLSKILGNKIKINDKTIYLKDTLYTIDHDYFGNPNKEPIKILSSDDKINYTLHTSFNKYILYYKDQVNKVYVYYDAKTLQYLGYSEDNKTIKKSKNNASLKMELSIKDCIMFLGYENQYINILHVKKDFVKVGNDSKEIILNIVRNRLNNLKQIILRSQSIIHNVRNSGQSNSIYSIDEKEIINEFTKKLKQFNIRDNNKHDNIFKNCNYIIHNLPIKNNIPENINIEVNDNYIDVKNINKTGNSDNKLIFYLIYNLNKLLDYNTQAAIESELSHLIIKLIRYLFNLYYRPYSNYNIRKFDFLLINETPYIDETLKVVGHYQELLSQSEIDDPQKKNKEYSANEALTSLDIDDYDVDDDIDETAEALDGYE